MVTYEDMIAQGWTPAQLAQFYPGLAPGVPYVDPGAQASSDVSYAASMATFERVAAMMYNQGLIGPVTEYQKQLALEMHPEIFTDLPRAQAEIGIPSDRSFAESHPEYATGTRYLEYGTTAPALLPQHELFTMPAFDTGPGQRGSDDWGDMLSMAVVGLLGIVAGKFLLGE